MSEKGNVVARQLMSVQCNISCRCIGFDKWLFGRRVAIESSKTRGQIRNCLLLTSNEFDVSGRGFPEMASNSSNSAKDDVIMLDHERS